MNEEDMIFPEGGFPTMAELTASTEPQGVSTACSNGAQGEGSAPKEGCAAAATAGADGAKSALQSGFFKESPPILTKAKPGGCAFWKSTRAMLQSRFRRA